MSKKQTFIIFLMIAVFSIILVGCGNKTVDQLENDYGIVVEGGSFEKGSLLVSNKVELNTTEAQSVLESLSSKEYNKSGNIYIFDIYVSKDDKKVQPNGKVKVSIPLPNQTIEEYVVFHVKDNSAIEELSPRIEGNNLVFEVESFSYFVVTEKAHQHSYNSVVTNPTCTEKGYTTYTCSCGDSYIDQYVDEVGHTFDEGVVTKVATCIEEGIRTYTCTVCKETKEETIQKTNHAYEFVEEVGPTCTKEGTVKHYHCEECNKNFDMNYGEIIDIIIEKLEHEYGDMYYASQPTFFNDGNIAYYFCEKCEKYFDEEYHEVETVKIPKLSTNLSICVNGVPTQLVIKEENESHIIWGLESLSVEKGDLITLSSTDNPSVIYNYFASGNVDKDGKILTTAQNVSVVAEATPNGIMLFIDGYKHEGIVIEINGEQYPMNSVTYPDATPTYIYGYVYLEKGDEFVIVDNTNNITYDYDNLDESDKWNIWDFHRGDDGQFVMDYSARYGIEFYIDEGNTILIDKVFAPFDGSSYDLVFEDETMDPISLTEINIPENDEVYMELLWFINNEEVINNQDIVEYITEHGLYIYTETVYLEVGDKFNIKNNTADSIINSEHLIDVYTYTSSFTINEDYIEILTDGYYMISYMPCFNGFMFSDSYVETADLFMYFDGEFIPLEIDDNNTATYAGLIAEANSNIAFVSNNYSEFYPIILDSNVDNSIAQVIESNGMTMAMFKKAGKYDLAYNVETGVLSIIDQNAEEPGDTPVEYIYFLSVVDYTNGNQTLYFSRTVDENNEVVINAANLFENCYIAVSGVAVDGSGSTDSYGALYSTDSSIAESLGTLILVKKSGQFDVYFNVETKSVKLVLAEDAEHTECTYDEGVVTKVATHTEEGIRTYTCTVCGETKEEVIEKTLGHSYGEWKPDEVEQDKHYRECLCKDKETGNCTYDEGIVTKVATHTEEGIRTYTCTECGRTKEEAIEKTLGHSFGEWKPDEVEQEKHYKACLCGEVEIGDCTFDENDTCTVCGREKEEESGITIVIFGGSATFVGKETVTTDSNLYGENANVYIAQANDVLNVSLTEQDGRTFKYWVSATNTIIPDEDFSILVLRSGYYYPVFEDTDINSYSNRVKIYEGNCEEGTLYMSTNSKGDVKYELEFENGGHHDFYDYEQFNNQYHMQKCTVCGETIYEKHTKHESTIVKEAGHAEEGQIKCECFCGHVWLESIPVTEDHTIDYDDWDIIEESINGQYGKYRVYCKYCDYYEEYWYLGNLDFIGFMDNAMIKYQYTYGGKVCHDEYYYSYRNENEEKVYIWAFQYEYENASNKDYNDTYIFMYIDDENSSTIEPIYLSKSRGTGRGEYLWAIYGYAYDANDWIKILDSPDFNIGCENGMLLSNSMSARSSVFESYHDYWAETYNKLRIPTTKEFNDLSDTVWEIEYEGKAFQDERDVIWYVKDKETSSKKYMYVDKETGITYGYEDLGTYYRTTFIMRTYKAIVSPEEFEELDDAGKSVVYSYGDIENDIKSLCSNRTLFNNFTLTLPETTTAFRLLFSDSFDCVEISGSDVNVYKNSAYVYNSGSPITFTWEGKEGIAFDRYEIWDFENQKWIVLSEEADYVFNTLENPRRTAAYVRVICHKEDIPVVPGETYRISVENGYIEIDGKEYLGTAEVGAGTLVYIYANEVDEKTFDHWLDGNGEEFSDNSFTVNSNMTFTPVYTDTLYRIYCSGWNYDSYVIVNRGEAHYSNEFEGIKGEKVELSTTPCEDSDCNVFIGWFMERYGSEGYEYILLSDSTTFTYEIKGDAAGSIYAVWTTGENPFIKKYVDIRIENGFVLRAGGEIGMANDNAYSAISVSSSCRVLIYDDPTDETVYTLWDITYKYELEGELIHDSRESYEDEYGYYPAGFWVDDPQYNYPDGEINITGLENTDEDLEEGSGVIIPQPVEDIVE